MKFLRCPDFGVQRFVTIVSIVPIATLRYGILRKIFYDYHDQQS